MRVEFYIELGGGADRLEIPWANPDEPTNRYYDLQAQPEAIGQLAEARENAALRRFLEQANAPASLFATAKCDTWRTDEFTDGERADFPAARRKAASYVDLFFALPEFNLHREHYEQLARRLMALVEPAPAAARVELCLRHCLYQDRGGWGFYLTFFLYGYGADAAEAQREWTRGLEALGCALARLSDTLRQAMAEAKN